MKLAVWLLLAAAFAGAQAPDKTPRFEVATIKPAAGTPGVSGCYGGPGTASPGQYTCTNATVTDMARKAFDLEFYQLNLKGGDQALWDVAAKIPASATRKQVLLMLQTLLAERFKMVHHIEKRRFRSTTSWWESTAPS